jgi:myo-inositol 2-dehydrogenase / D-chiro-inositol 1-dehydrogenase
MDRRQFLQRGGQAASAMLLLKSNTAFGYEANSAVRLGLLGCGNRGTQVAVSFSRHVRRQVASGQAAFR